MKNVVIVGGGAGGIELATFLGDKLGRKKQAKVTLVIAMRPTCGNPYYMKLLRE